MDTQRYRGLMGLCVRARQAVFGEDGCLKALRNGECGILLMDAGISRTAEEKYRRNCERAGVPAVLLPENLMEEATGRPGRAMAVKKGSLAEQLISLADCPDQGNSAEDEPDHDQQGTDREVKA